jgi:hypothetical protein
MTTFQGVASSGKVAYFTAIFPYIGEYHFVYNLFSLFLLLKDMVDHRMI